MKKKSEDPFVKLLIKERRKYDKVKVVYCPALKSDVKFNKIGFRHLHIDGRGHYRGRKDAKLRLHLMKHAANIVKSAKITKKDLTKKGQIYYELYGKISPVTIVVVTVRVVGNGNPHFYGIRYKKRKRNRPQK